MSETIDITIQPPPAGWREMLARRSAADPRSRAFREALRLPLDRPVIASGHQATIWHAGIMAKYVAVAHACDVLGAAPLWVVVDHDPEDFTTLAAPARVPAPGGGTGGDGGRGERLVRREVRLVSEEIAALLAGGCAPGGIGPVPVRDPAAALGDALAEGSATAALPGVAEAVARIGRALSDAAAGTRSAAEQVAAATAALIAPILDPVKPLPTIMASSLARTEFFGWLVGMMRDDPMACARAYNAAAAESPDARIALLATRTGRGGNGPEPVELPLWHVRPGDPIRRRVWSSDLASIPRQELAPRALLLTGLLRLAGCDLFVHGTGGGGADGASGYDAITERWFAEWLGMPLAPTATVTATLTLPLLDARDPAPTRADAARARWRAHHARHDGAFLGPEAAGAKSAALGVIAATRDRSARRQAYAAMHRALAAARSARAGAMADLAREADRVAARAADGEVARDRTWPFPLHGIDRLREFSRAMRDRFAP